MMSRNNSEAPPCKATEPFNFEKNGKKLPPHESLRSPGALPNHPNFRLKGSENGNKKNNFLLCEQTKQYLASQEDNSASSNPSSINEEAIGSQGDRKKSPAGNSESSPSVENNSPKEVNTVPVWSLVTQWRKPENNVHPAKSKKLHKLVGNSLSINNPGLFTSLGPPLRSTTCHRCGLFGSLRCSQCKQTYYCSTACQRRDWSAHSIVCKPVQPNDCPLGVTKEIAMWAKKVMFSDLRSLQLKKTMEIKGTVTEFKHPGDFYAQLYSSEVLEYMNQLSASLKETYANVHEKDYIPVTGEVCVAKYTVDQTWNRVIIQDVDVLQKKAHVLYIDYGNEEIIPLNRIYQLNSSIDLFPPCAIKCFLANVIPAEGNWSTDCIKATKPLLMEQYCTIKIVDILEEVVVTFAVEVKLPNSGKLLDHVLIEMGYGLKPNGQDSKKESADQIAGATEIGRIMRRMKLGPATCSEELCWERWEQNGKNLARAAEGKRFQDWVSSVMSDAKKESIVLHSEKSLLDSTFPPLFVVYPSHPLVFSGDPEDAGKMIADNKIVVDKSDLIPKVLSLNIGDEFCGVVAHIQTPEDFFCQQLQSGRKLAELQASLSEYCGQLSPRSDFYPAIGDICCAQFSEDDQWYRASVLAYASEDSVLVGYVDYGNFEILSLMRLCPIIPKLLELPMQAIKCVLAGVKPSLGIWTPEAICLMKKLVQNKIITVKVVDKLENSSLVELIDKSKMPHVSISKVLIDAAFAVGEQGMVADKPSDMKEASADSSATPALLHPPSIMSIYFAKYLIIFTVPLGVERKVIIIHTSKNSKDEEGNMKTCFKSYKRDTVLVSRYGIQ
ncbi:Tudor domain-containing protein 1 [Saguinus oedipus]|uniref:Tudor domain-containing protein 1 n=1 Tax=Saguinus oedipus TaxID=9490 RepID=A0ABQ9UPP2_SAGOE|nr:Tudor domain-containing protein 1 [Saguinus oedipus]